MCITFTSDKANNLLKQLVYHNYV